MYKSFVVKLNYRLLLSGEKKLGKLFSDWIKNTFSTFQQCSGCKKRDENMYSKIAIWKLM